MAVAVVNRLCTPTLAALKQAGLEYLLLDEAQAQALRDKTREAARQTASPDVRPRVAEASPVARGTQSPARDTQERRAESERQSFYQGSPRDTQKTPRAQAATQQARHPDQDVQEIPWPAVWREHLAKTRAAPVVWTYWELGLDLCGTPDPKRRELLRELLQDLAHPPGTHCFWPSALPGRDGTGEPEANAPVFWEGVKLLRGRAVMIMGEQALRALALPGRMLAMPRFQPVRRQGRLLIVLPPPDLLIQEPQRMQALREFLRQELAPFA